MEVIILSRVVQRLIRARWSLELLLGAAGGKGLDGFVELGPGFVTGVAAEFGGSSPLGHVCAQRDGSGD